MHQFDILDHPIMKDGLHRSWEETAELPMHHCFQILLISLDNLLAAFASVVVLVIPHQVVPVLFDLEVDEMKRRVCPNGLQDILAVCISVSYLCLGCLKEETRRACEYDVRTNTSEFSHQPLE